MLVGSKQSQRHEQPLTAFKININLLLLAGTRCIFIMPLMP